MASSRNTVGIPAVPATDVLCPPAIPYETELKVRANEVVAASLGLRYTVGMAETGDWRVRQFRPQGHDTFVVGRMTRSRLCKTCAANYQRGRREIINAQSRTRRGSVPWPSPADDKHARQRLVDKKHYHKNRLVRVNRSLMRWRGFSAHSKNGLAAVVDYYGGNQCVYCQKPATGFDHLQPVSKGGDESLLNLAPCCKSCNSSKGSRPIWTMIARGGGMSPCHTKIL